MFREVLAYALRSSPLLVGVIAVLSLLSALLETATLALLAPLIAILTHAPSSVYGWPLNRVMVLFSGAPRTELILVFAPLLIGLMVIRFLVISGNFWLIGDAEARLVRHLRQGCLDTLFFSPQAFLDGYDNARIIQHFNEQSLRAGKPCGPHSNPSPHFSLSPSTSRYCSFCQSR